MANQLDPHLLSQESRHKPNEDVGKKNCVFCSIANGDTPSYIVFKDLHSVAFLDKKPLFPGHSLLIPIQHYETLTDLPRDLLDPLAANAQLLASAVQRGMRADGSFVAINNKVSQSVPHLHIHIVPRRERDGLKGFFWPRQNYASTQEIIDVQTAVRNAISEIRSEQEVSERSAR